MQVFRVAAAQLAGNAAQLHVSGSSFGGWSEVQLVTQLPPRGHGRSCSCSSSSVRVRWLKHVGRQQGIPIHLGGSQRDTSHDALAQRMAHLDTLLQLPASRQDTVRTSAHTKIVKALVRRFLAWGRVSSVSCALHSASALQTSHLKQCCAKGCPHAGPAEMLCIPRQAIVGPPPIQPQLVAPASVPHASLSTPRPGSCAFSMAC